MDYKRKKLLRSMGFSLLSMVYLILLSLGYSLFIDAITLPNFLKGILFYVLLFSGFTILFKIAQNNKNEQ